MERYIGTITSPFKDELIEMVNLTISENLIEIEFNYHFTVFSILSKNMKIFIFDSQTKSQIL